ncbi:MAG: outer membrane beta-barrel domain-containing protein [Agarilytica sp.]
MANRFQHIFLKLALLVLCSQWVANANAAKLRADNELFDVGATVGVLNIEDFTSEYVYGLYATFKASEHYFLQYNFIQTEVGESSFEKNAASATFAIGENRTFQHYDLLIGYNIFQGEFYGSGENAHLSNLYIVGGIGNTDFGDESNFTYTFGVGYQIEFYRKWVTRIDYRDHIYKTSLIIGGGEETVQNTQFSLSLGYLF